MKKFLIYSLSLLLPVFVGISLINYIVDPGHIYSETYIDNVVKGLLKGKNVANVADINERALKEKFIEAHKGESFDYIVIGASRIMTISKDVFDNSKILNLGMSGSKIEDLIAIYELCLENNVKYKNIIIGVEPTFFNNKDNDTRWKYLERYYNSFMGIKHASIDMSLITNLFSPSYFKISLLGIGNIFKNKSEIQYTDNYVNDGATKRSDGSIYYAKDYREREQSLIDKESTTWLHGSFKDYKILSKEREKIFENLLLAIRKDGVKIYFYKGAYHPFFYNRIIKIPGVYKGIEYIDSIAKKYDVIIIGSYNPSDVGLNNKDFYDAAHVRKESLDKSFREEFCKY